MKLAFLLAPGDVGRMVELRSGKRKAEGGEKEVAEGREGGQAVWGRSCDRPLSLTVLL